VRRHWPLLAVAAWVTVMVVGLGLVVFG